MSRNNIKILPGALVCEESKLRGDITIGSGTIVHPSATIIAEAGPIIIGDCCLIEEQVKIIHRLPFDQQNKENTTPVLIIGSHNVFEVDCTVESPKIGNNNVFESKCFVGNKVTVSNGCTIGAGCRITDEQILKENLIIFGSKCEMREGLDRPGKLVTNFQCVNPDVTSKICRLGDNSGEKCKPRALIRKTTFSNRFTSIYLQNIKFITDGQY